MVGSFVKGPHYAHPLQGGLEAKHSQQALVTSGLVAFKTWKAPWIKLSIRWLVSESMGWEVKRKGEGRLGDGGDGAGAGGLGVGGGVLKTLVDPRTWFAPTSTKVRLFIFNHMENTILGTEPVT